MILLLMWTVVICIKKGDASVKILEKLPQIEEDILYTIGGPSLNGGNCGENQYIDIVVTKKSNGQPHEIDVSSLFVILGDKKSIGNHNFMKIAATQNSKGKYNATFVITDPGSYPVDVVYQGASVLTSQRIIPLVYREVGSTSKTVFVELPSSIWVKEKTTLTIQARNKSGKDIRNGGEEFEVLAQGPESISDLRITDNGDGKYHVTFTAPNSGIFEISVKQKDTHISNSPIKLIAQRR